MDNRENEPGDPPAYLGDEGRAFWDRNISLAVRGDADRDLFGLLCLVWERALTSKGKRFQVLLPCLLRMAREFGLTPAARKPGTATFAATPHSGKLAKYLGTDSKLAEFIN